MALDKMVRIKVSHEQKEHYYKLAKIEYEGNFSGMAKDLLKKYEEELKKKGVNINGC